MRAADVLSGLGGGRYHGGFKISKLDVTRSENAVWGMNETLGFRPVPARVFYCRLPVAHGHVVSIT